MGPQRWARDIRIKEWKQTAAAVMQQTTVTIFEESPQGFGAQMKGMCKKRKRSHPVGVLLFDVL